MRKQKFRESIDYICFKDFYDLHLDKVKYFGEPEQTFGENLPSDFIDNVKFEYPFLFLDLMQILSGQKVHYQPTENKLKIVNSNLAKSIKLDQNRKKLKNKYIKDL